ncbi:MAG: hypothetical protein AB1796_05145 [Bacillota bacterium]
MNSLDYPEAVGHNYPEISKIPGTGSTLDLLERGIVTFNSTTVSLLGIDILGIRQFKLVTTLDTWLACAGLF